MQTYLQRWRWYFSVVFFIFALILIPSFAFAEGVSLNTSTSTAIFTIAPFDQSVLYLSELFGNVPPFLNGTGSQLMGHLFKVFNTAILTLGVIFAGYTTFVGILNTAGEGEMLGKGWHSIWIPIRTVAGIALLIPTSSGYCVCQLFMMWLLMQGIGAADTLTSTIVNYMETDMPVFAPAEGVLTSPDNTDPMENLYKNDDGVSHYGNNTKTASASTFYDSTITMVFQGLSCMQINYKNNSKYTGKQIPTITTDSSNNTITYNFQPILTPQSTNVSNTPTPTLSSCGKLIINSSAKPDSNTAILAKAISQGLNAIIPSLNATAYYMVNQADTDQNVAMQNTFDFVGGSGFLTELERTYSSFISQAHYDYLEETTSKTSHNGNGFYEDIRNLGWVTLGTIYWDMAKDTGSAVDTDTKDAIILWNNTQQGDIVSWQTDSTPNIANTDSEARDYDPTNSNIWIYGNTWASQFIADLSTSRSKGGNGGAYQSAGSQNDPGKIGTNAMAAITMGTLNSMQERLSGSKNPMVEAQALGHEISLTVEIVSMSLIAASLGFAAIWGMGSSVNSAFLVAQLAMALILPGLMLFMGIILALAGTLSVIIPMIPALAYFLAVIAWLIATLETIVAAPIVALGVLHPDGQHQVWGKAEPAVMLIINMFLRPSLIVVGMAAGVILSFITMQFVNFGFNQAILTLLGDKAPTSIESLLFLTTYVGIVLACVNKSFSTIDIIPEQVMRWIQGGEGTKFGSGQEAMQKIQQGQEGHAKGGGDDAAHAVKSNAQAGNEANAAVQKDKEQAKGGGGGGGDEPAPAGSGSP